MTRRETIRIYLAVGCGAALGSLLRLLVAVGTGAWPVVPPYSTTGIVNVAGSFVIGFFATLTGPDGRIIISPAGRQFVMGGLCGGLTTFSAMSLDTLILLLDRPGVAALYLAAVVLLSLCAVFAGHALAARLNR